MRERVQKILAAAGVASRRRCEEFLRAGRVSVNGEPARLGDSADADVDVVALDGVPLVPEPIAFWLVNKPRGVLSTARDPEGRRTVLDLLPGEARAGGRLYPVGRLDRDTEGLLLLTNDGETAHALLHPSFGNEREYRVTVRGAPTQETLRALARGVPLDGARTAPVRVGRARYDARSDTATFRLTLIEGRKRQIRRSLRALGHPVARLVRVRMGPLRLGELRPTAARPLSARERRALREHVRKLARARSTGRTSA